MADRFPSSSVREAPDGETLPSCSASLCSRPSVSGRGRRRRRMRSTASPDRDERDRGGAAHRHDWPMIGRDATNTRSSAVRAQDPAGERASPGDQMGGDDGRRRVGDAGGRGRRRVLRRLWRHALEARRRDRQRDLVAHGAGLHRESRATIARTSPSLAGNTLVVGDLKAPEHAGHRREDRGPALDHAGAS